MNRIFITGASGFIGANLVRRLAAEGHEIVALLRKDSYHPFLKDIKIQRVEGDVTNKSSVREAMRDCKYVFNCAAKVSFSKYDRNELYRINVEGIKNVLEAAYESRIEKLVHVSACAVFGYSPNKDSLLTEDTVCEIPESSVYAYTKKLSEDEVKKFCSKGLDATIANLCTVYGQGDKALNSGAIIKSVYLGRLKVAPPGGTSAISVDDVVEGLLLLLRKGKCGENYILANEQLEYLDLCNKIATALGVNGVKYKLPEFFYYPLVSAVIIGNWAMNTIGRGQTFMTPTTISESFGYKYYSSKKARTELEWSPQVNLKEAVEKAFKFYKEEGLIS